MAASASASRRRAGVQDTVPVLACQGRDRGCAELEPSACGTVGLADHQQCIGHLGDAREERNPEGTRAEETDASNATH